MSEQLMTDNPAILGPTDQDGDAYVFFLADGPTERAVCHSCALEAFAAGESVTLGGTFALDDPFAPAECESCGRPIDNQYRAELDGCSWLDALSDALDDIARDPRFALSR